MFPRSGGEFWEERATASAVAQVQQATIKMLHLGIQ